MFGRKNSSSDNNSSVSHNDRMFLASQDVYRRIESGECKDAEAELMQAAYDVSDGK
ncbi:MULTISPECIES: hypothetical protein [unclassified Streptomyces]|uniref:hypothetical protein n=1 Tax=unclassified Streptomyces TaxID=2593676 RepID=UPI000AE03713|nr:MULTISPECIES: hypothetical protein [unclassified Streptomyces]